MGIELPARPAAETEMVILRNGKRNSVMARRANRLSVRLLRT